MAKRPSFRILLALNICIMGEMMLENITIILRQFDGT